MIALEFNAVRRGYTRGVNVLDGVDFVVESGQVVGLVGQNGAGKTTLIRLAMGMLEPQAGRVRVLGRDPRREPLEVKRRVGYVAEDQILPGFLTVEAVIALHRSLFPTWDEDLARRLLERFAPPAGAKIRALSKGQARRVALICAVAHRPEALLLDEPASGLDPAARREFLEASIELLNDSGSAILFSSHHLTDIERMADRIVMLHDGKVLIDRALDDLKEGYALALVPRAAGVNRERLLQVSGCLAVRERPDGWRAVLQLEPAAARAALEQTLGVADVRCQTVPLEEMFIELAGGRP